MSAMVENSTMVINRDSNRGLLFKHGASWLYSTTAFSPAALQFPWTCGMCRPIRWWV